MLEQVGVDIPATEGDVRLDVIAELDDFDFVAFLFELWLDRLFDHVAIRTACRPDLDRLVFFISTAVSTSCEDSCTE